MKITLYVFLIAICLSSRAVFGQSLVFEDAVDCRLYPELPPDEAAIAYRNLAARQDQNQNYTEAIISLSCAIQLKPDYALAYYERGSIFQVVGDYSQAIADASQAIELKFSPIDWVYDVRGWTYFNLGEYEYAIADYNLAIQFIEDTMQLPKYYFSRGAVYQRLNNHIEAIQNFTLAIKIDSNDSGAYNSRGVSYYEQGEYQFALADYNRAIELDPTNANIYYNRGGVYDELGDYESAISDYNRAIQLGQTENLTNYYTVRGTSYTHMGNYEQALADHNYAIELAPQNPAAYYNRGKTYEQQDEYRLALHDYNTSIELDPDGYIGAYITRGDIYKKIGDDQKAEADYIHATLLDPDMADAYKQLGRLYDSQFKYPRALENYHTYLDLAGEDTDPEIARRVLELERGQVSLTGL